MSNPQVQLDATASGIYTTYLSYPEVEKRIRAYEKGSTASNLEILVTLLMSFAFNIEDSWIIKDDADNERKHTNYHIWKINKNEADKDNNKTLHTLVKVILDPTDPFPNEWEQTIPDLHNAPMKEDRCWVILIRGLELRLLEYHRDQKPGIRAIPCDFETDGRMCETVHIRDNVTEVGSILDLLPYQWPAALSDVEIIRLEARLKAVDLGDGSECSTDIGWGLPESTLIEEVSSSLDVQLDTTSTDAIDVTSVASQVEDAAETNSTASQSGLALNAQPVGQTKALEPDEATAKGPTKVELDKVKATPRDKAPQLKIRTQFDTTPTPPAKIGPQDPLAQAKMTARLKSVADEKTREIFKKAAIQAKTQSDAKTKEDFKSAVKARIQSDGAQATHSTGENKARDQPSTATAKSKTSRQPKPAGKQPSKPGLSAQAKKLAQLKANAANKIKPAPQAKSTDKDEVTSEEWVSRKRKGDKDS
jgi:hypothetical protein